MDFITLMTTASSNSIMYISQMSTVSKRTRAIKRAIGEYMADNLRGAAIVSKMAYHSGNVEFNTSKPYCDLPEYLQDEVDRQVDLTIERSNGVDSSISNYFVSFGRYNLGLLTAYREDEVNELIRQSVNELLNHFDT